MPALVDVAIGMILVFLVAAVTASAMNEFVEGIVRRRPKYLKAALNRSISSQFATDLYATRWLKTLRTPLGRLQKHAEGVISTGAASTPDDAASLRDPSYIPSDVFAAAVRELLEQGAVEPLRGLNDDDVAAALELIPTTVRSKLPADLDTVPEIRAALQRLAADGDFWTSAQQAIVDSFPPHVLDDLDHEARNLQRWYEATMDRMSGWYKRRTKWWLVLWGALIAVGFNVDAIALTQALWSDDAVRAAAVATAEDLADQDDPTCTVDVASGDDPLRCLDAALDQLRSAETFGLPLGWVWPWDWGDRAAVQPAPAPDGTPVAVITVADSDARIPVDAGGWILKIIGLLVTAIAVSFGAPVWFDLLNKVVNFRASGAKPAPGGTSGALSGSGGTGGGTN